IGLITIGVNNFYHSLILLALYPQAEPSQQKQYMLAIEQNQANLREWSDCAPQNFLHKYLLIKAEQARVFGNVLEAIEYYDQAIQGAKDTEYLQEEALANELAAEFYLGWGKEKFAASYLQEAYYCYAHWGAKSKTDDLKKRYPQLLTAILQSPQNRFILQETLISNSNRSSISHQTIPSTHSSSSSISESLDFATILKASQALSGEIQLDQLISTLVQIVMKNAGADKCNLILVKGENLVIEATAALGGEMTNNQAVARRMIPVESSQDVPTSIINYVSRTLEIVVIDDAFAQTSLALDAYIQKQKPKSLLCAPIVNQGKLIGIIYLENRLTQGVFTSDRLQVIQLLMAQAAISLENAQLYNQLEDYSYTLEQKVEERTQELQEKATQLEATLQKLYATQSQLIQTEKMSSLGQLVAGIAHEINNPVNFIHGNLNHAHEYITSLIELIDLYQELSPQAQPKIQSKIDEIDLEFIIEDLPMILVSMTTGTERIRQIVESLRNFSRLDESEIKPIDIHSGIDSTLLILQHRLKASEKHQEIQVIKDYGKLPLINCYASALNQVFMNILSNGIDALRQQENGANLKKKLTLMLQTSVDRDHNAVIHIADNGIGIEPSVVNKIFEPFFTTKPVGKGTGLGLSVSYSIIVEKHGGSIEVNSTLGERTEFTIVLPI
ncbi:MAG: ATP-binding protein, partial [Microcoleus sp.]